MARVIKLTRTWTLGRKLGEGSFGKVYEATDENGARAAAKLVRKLPGADREALIASELNGVPKIMPIIETGETPTDYVIVMPLAERSLGAELAARGAAIPVDEAVPILADIAEALVGMHAKEVISRDVKPLNVLLLGGAWHVSDFGIARYADSSTALHTFKDRGTEAYTAPERWRGERAKKASDIYSFGVLAHEVLAGELPFKGPNFGEQHLRATPPALSNVPPRLASLVLEITRQVTRRPAECGDHPLAPARPRDTAHTWRCGAPRGEPGDRRSERGGVGEEGDGAERRGAPAARLRGRASAIPAGRGDTPGGAR